MIDAAALLLCLLSLLACRAVLMGQKGKPQMKCEFRVHADAQEFQAAMERLSRVYGPPVEHVSACGRMRWSETV
jgi:hypothetical protein